MATKTLGEALASAIAKGLICGVEGTAGTVLPAPGKEAGAEAPAKFREETRITSGDTTPTGEATQPGNTPASRAKGTGRPVHHKAQPQRRTGRPLLLVIEGGLGGRPARMGVMSRAAFRASGEEGGPARKLVLVEGGRGHAALL